MADNLKVVNIDGVDYESEAPVIAELTKFAKRVDELTDEIAVNLDSYTVEIGKVTAERDTALEQVKTLTADNAKLKTDSVDPKIIAKAVNERVKILDSAHVLGVDIKDETTNIDAMKAVIQKVYPATKFDNLEGKEAGYIDSYITARFDGAVETIVKKADGQKREAFQGDNLPPDPAKKVELTRDSIKAGDAEAARERMKARQHKDSRLAEEA